MRTTTGRTVQNTGMAMLAACCLITSSATPGRCTSDAEQLAWSLQEAFLLRDVELYGALLSEEFAYAYSCSTLGRERELEMMAIIFEDESRYEFVSTEILSVGEQGESATIFFKFEVRLHGEDPVTDSVAGTGALRAYFDESGEWLISEWTEIFTGETACGSGLGWGEAKSRWSALSATAVPLTSWSSVKAAAADEQ